MDSKNQKNSSALMDICITLVLSVFVYLIARPFDILDSFYEYSRQHEETELDELAILFVFFTVAFLVVSIRQWIRERASQMELSLKNEVLKEALEEIEELRKAIVPICARCNKIKDNDGNWQQLEDFFNETHETQFSHGVCPDCAEQLYPGFIGEKSHTSHQE